MRSEPLEVTRKALHEYALKTPDTREMAQASEALRLIGERQELAQRLFDMDAHERPVTVQQEEQQ